ncbi:HGGxSTG domain-containing protein [Thermaurantiacus sp.]
MGAARRGGACQTPAVKGRKRCRMHGGTNPGAPRGNRNAWKHGARCAEVEALVRGLPITEGG